jgi:putative folate metabolism gamma-glutamate ligase
MRIHAIRTRAIHPGERLLDILGRYVRAMPESAILAVTSKIVALGEGRTVPKDTAEKDTLIAREADLILSPPRRNPYGITLTIKRGTLIPTAGIDESNADGQYVLWPANPQRSANRIRAYLSRQFSKTRIGVIITDSTTRPLRRGTVGTCLAWSGFQALHDYVGTPDIFGAPLRVTQANVAEGLAAAAVLSMGEGAERTPLALITDVPFIAFTGTNPSKKELAAARIALAEDLYAPLLTAVTWKKGKGRRR